MFTRASDWFDNVPGAYQTVREYFAKYITINDFLDALDIISGETLHQLFLNIIEHKLSEDGNGYVDDISDAALSFGVITGVKTAMVITKTLTLLLWLHRHNLRKKLCGRQHNPTASNLVLIDEAPAELGNKASYDDYLEHSPLSTVTVPFHRSCCAHVTEIFGTAGLGVGINAITQINIGNSYALADFIAIMMKRIILKVGDHLCIVCACGGCYAMYQGYQRLTVLHEQQSLLDQSAKSYYSFEQSGMTAAGNALVLDIDMTDQIKPRSTPKIEIIS